MATVNITTVSNGTTADATVVAGNFNNLKTFVEGSVVQADGSVKAGTSAIADSAVTTAKLADNSVTGAKIPVNSFFLTYQDFVITGLTELFGQWTTAPTKITLTGGKTYQNVVSVQCLGGLNAYGLWAGIQGMGLQSLILNANEIIIQAAVSNNAANGNYLTVRVWLTN